MSDIEARTEFDKTRQFRLARRWIGIPIAVTIPIWVLLCIYSNSRPDLLSYGVFSLLIVYASMLGFWLGLGDAWWRWIVVPLISPALGLCAGIKMLGEQLQFQVFCLAIVAIVAFTTLVLRFWKGRLRYVADSELLEDALQFGIKDILIWTSAVAILLAVWQRLAEFVEERNDPSFNILLLILGLSGSIAIATVFNIWAFLGQQVSVIKIFTLILAICAASTAILFMVPTGPFFVCVTLIAQVLLLVMLLVLRRIGLRFAK